LVSSCSSDIFRTILLPRPTVRALPLSPLLGRLFVPLWFKATERIKSTRLLQTFRSIDEDREWLAVFGAVLDAAALLLAATETQRPTAPAARMFLPIGCRTVGSLERLFAVHAAPTRDATVDREQFKVMRERLRSAGYSFCKPEDAAYIRFQQLREDYRPDLIALCRHLRILLQEPPLQGSQPEIARPKRKRTPTTQAEVKA
jgi:hypothetical protein